MRLVDVAAHEVTVAPRGTLKDLLSSIITDLTGLEFMDSSGIALLVSATRNAGQVELRHPTPIVRRLIELTGLTELLLMVP